MRRDVRILLVGDGGKSFYSVGHCTLTTPCPCRGRRQKHNSHVSNQGVLRSSCVSKIFDLDLSPKGSYYQVQHVVPEVTIPPEVTPENVTTYIVDSGGVPAISTRILET